MDHAVDVALTSSHRESAGCCSELVAWQKTHAGVGMRRTDMRDG